MQQLRLSPNWRLEQRSQELYIFGGQDAIFTIELEPGQQSFFASLKHNQKFQSDDLTTADKVVLEQLLSAKVILPVLAMARSKHLTVRFIGNTQMIAKLAKNIHAVSISQTNPDLVILVRTNEKLEDFLKHYDYLVLGVPHLFLDLAYYQTISLGPLVFPGATACVACLQGRLKSRWGDEKPPDQPKSSQSLLALAAAWLDSELTAILTDQDYALVNKTIALTVQDRNLTHNKLLTVPLCPYCKKSELLRSGRLAYTTSKA